MSLTNILLDIFIKQLSSRKEIFKSENNVVVVDELVLDDLESLRLVGNLGLDRGVLELLDNPLLDAGRVNIEEVGEILELDLGINLAVMLEEKFLSSLVDLVSKVLEEKVVETLLLYERKLFFGFLEVEIDDYSADMLGEAVLVGDSLPEQFLEDIDIVLSVELEVLRHKLESGDVPDEVLGDVLHSRQHSLMRFHFLDGRVDAVGHGIDELFDLTIVGLLEIDEGSLVKQKNLVVDHELAVFFETRQSLEEVLDFVDHSSGLINESEHDSAAQLTPVEVQLFVLLQQILDQVEQFLGLMELLVLVQELGFFDDLGPHSLTHLEVNLIFFSDVFNQFRSLQIFLVECWKYIIQVFDSLLNIWFETLFVLDLFV